jgi:hypothetical protein
LDFIPPPRFARFVAVPEHPGYRINRAGVIQSCWIGRNRMGSLWKTLKPGLNFDGYRTVSLKQGERRCTRFVHHLVLETFVGPRPPGTECLHKNSNPADNRLSNLKWGTHAENVKTLVKLKMERNLAERRAKEGVKKRGRPRIRQN